MDADIEALVNEDIPEGVNITAWNTSMWGGGTTVTPMVQMKIAGETVSDSVTATGLLTLLSMQ